MKEFKEFAKNVGKHLEGRKQNDKYLASSCVSLIHTYIFYIYFKYILKYIKILHTHTHIYIYVYVYTYIYASHCPVFTSTSDQTGEKGT